MALFVLHKLILQMSMPDVWFLVGPFFRCVNSEGSGKTAWMRRLAWAFACRWCDKYHNLMSWLNWWWLKLGFMPLLSIFIQLSNNSVWLWQVSLYILAYPDRYFRPGLRNVVLHGVCKTTLMHDVSMMSWMSFLTSWHHFHISFHQTFRCQHIERSCTEHFLIEICSYFSIKLMKQHIFKSKCNFWRKSMQEKEYIMVLRCKLKIPSLG